MEVLGYRLRPVRDENRYRRMAVKDLPPTSDREWWRSNLVYRYTAEYHREMTRFHGQVFDPYPYFQPVHRVTGQDEWHGSHGLELDGIGTVINIDPREIVFVERTK